ncbi:MAG: peroxiredoxin [bacterium]|nr:peroxiredoxin [bacterium]
MTISVGDKLPAATFMTMGAGGPAPRESSDVFDGRTVALFSVPGAYTPTCSMTHLPNFIKNADTLKAKGVDEVICTAVNDIFVLDAWGKASSISDNITMLADGSAAFAKATGLDLDLTESGLGMRSLRYAMLVVDGTVKTLNIEDDFHNAEQSSAEALLESL